MPEWLPELAFMRTNRPGPIIFCPKSKKAPKPKINPQTSPTANVFQLVFFIMFNVPRPVLAYAVISTAW